MAKKQVVMIQGMMCEGCAHRVEAALKALPGVKDVKVSLKDKNALVKVEEPLEESLYKKAIEDAGYTCTGVK
jgi:copper chaperone CopZ